MTAEQSQTTGLPVEQLRDTINTLMHTVTALLEGELTLDVLETALNSHDALRDQLAAQIHDTSTLAALQRIEQFITLQAGHYYQTASADFDEQQNSRFLTLFARQLLALDGIGPATARQLFQLGVFTPKHFLHYPQGSRPARLARGYVSAVNSTACPGTATGTVQRNKLRPHNRVTLPGLLLTRSFLVCPCTPE
ncbi:hypothetical protein HORIV_32840 [Vreelandella olivaria]|uniref:Uncharacterized protein n=1 Tax=Vreelandella olivaria TaxID=390919 RepID=A0ABN5X184_9GAMM|nr:hypothetical protein HORIV_32840 [Halomonas olivaria]